MANNYDQAKVDRLVVELSKLLDPLPPHERLRALFAIAKEWGITEQEVTDNPDLWSS
jgi:hypothetical protein